MDLRLENQGLTTQKSGTYDSKTRDLRHERAIVTTRKYYSYDPKYNFNGAKHRFFYMIIMQKSFIFNDKLNDSFTYYDR